MLQKPSATSKAGMRVCDDVERGVVLVSSVTQDGLAAASGVRKGDRIIALGDRPLQGFGDVSARLSAVPAGGCIKIAVRLPRPPPQQLRQVAASASGPSDEAMLNAMATARARIVGADKPRNWCFDSSNSLLAEIQARGLEAQLGRGTARVVDGAFLADPTMRGAGYVDWHAHSFVVFGDGSIADCTADQFDGEVPKLWWPAEASRYSLNKQDAVDAASYRLGRGDVRLRDH